MSDLREKLQDIYAKTSDVPLLVLALIDDVCALREALKFYQDTKNWAGPDDGESTEISESDCYRNTNMNDDLFGGLTALKALEQSDQRLKQLGVEGVRMGVIREVKCDFCNKRVKQTYNGEHWLAPKGWGQIWDEETAQVTGEYICPKCQPKKKVKK